MADGYLITIDWDDDGIVTGTGENVTADVLQRGPVTFQYGRDQARALSPPRVGAVDMTLCNPDGVFSPENPNSPISADIAPAARITASETIDSTLYPLITGRVDTFQLHTSRGDMSAEITGLDDLALLRGTEISTRVYTAQRTGTLIGVILDAVGWTAGRDLDLGATHVPWWWASNKDAFELLNELLRSEGPPSIAYVAPDGTFTFRDRHHRLLRPASLTSQATFSATPIDCDSTPVTQADEIGHLTALDTAATLPTDDFATVTIPNDGTVTAGDLLLIGAVMPSGSRTFTISGGAGDWTSLGSAAQSGHTSQVWWRIAETGDLGATITVTPSSPNIRQVLLLGSVANADSSNPIAASASVTTTDTTPNTTPTVTSVPAGSREVSFVWDSRGASVPQTSNWVAPAEQTRRLQEFTTSGSGASSGAAGDSDATVSGTVGGRDWVPDQSAIGSAWTIAVGPALKFIDPFEYEIGWRDIVNSVQLQVEERVLDGVLSTVWESDDTISLAIGESVIVEIEVSDPFLDAQPITAADGDIVFGGAGVPVVVLSGASGQSVTATITAVGGSVVVTFLRLRAMLLPVVRTVRVSASDATSISRHGERTYQETVPWANQNDAFAVTQLLLGAYAERRPTVQLPIVSSDLAHHLQVVGRQISDLITIRNGHIGLYADFFIENIGHTLTRMVTEETCPGPVHYATFGCERSGVVVPDNPFTFDKVGAGFDDGVFSPTGLDDPDTVFIFDHPTQGQFDVGAFGT